MKVSIVIPVFNEGRHISHVLQHVIEQDWKDELEILVIDGQSTDDTPRQVKAIASCAPENRRIRLLNNVKRHIPVALNIGCSEATGDVIIRLDGHTFPPLDYVSTMVKALSAVHRRGIVGGRWSILPSNDSIMAKSIACAVAHPYGVGNASYRIMKESDSSLPFMMERDTVPFGAFSKQLWLELSGYDEEMHSNEDYDFNFRARKLGYGVWLVPSVALQYFARGTLGQLWRQYFRYGFWVARFLLKHSSIPALRKIIPLSFVLCLLILVSIRPLWALYLIITYLMMNGVFAIHALKQAKLSWNAWWWLVICFAVLHWSYAIGNILGLLTFFVSHRRK